MHEGKPYARGETPANVEGLEDAPESTRGNPEDERKRAQEGPNRARDNRPEMGLTGYRTGKPRSLPSCSHFSSQLASPRLAKARQG